jgi:SAM-dependent methyltransferase
MTNEEHDMWDSLNIEYEHAYRNNPFKRDCVEKAIALLKPGSRVLDVGCGTGVPVAKMLADAGMDVVGSDVAPQMVKLSQANVKGTFEVADMLRYEPAGTFDAIFIVFSHLGLTYSDFHGAVYKLAKTLRRDGLLVVGQAPAEQIVPPQDSAWDGTKSYVEGYNLPFWGQPFPTLMFSRAGQKAFLRSMGFTIQYDEVNTFQPDNPKCDPEGQQYVVAQRQGDEMVKEPLPKPAVRKQM